MSWTTFPLLKEHAHDAGLELAEFEEALELPEAMWKRAGPGHHSPFGSRSWHDAYWRVAPPVERINTHVLVSRDPRGDVDAFFPIRLKQQFFSTSIQFALGPIGAPDFLSLPAENTEPYRKLGMFARELPYLKGIEFRNLKNDASLVEAARRGLESAGFDVSIAEDQWCPGLSLPANWEDFLATLNRRRRESIRRSQRRLAGQFQVEFQDDSSLLRPGILDTLFSWNQNRFGAHSALHNDRLRSMIAHFCLAQARTHNLWLYTLALDSEPAAIWLGFRQGESLLYYQSGWNDKFAAHSVGTVLMAKMIEKAIEAGVEHFSFLRGNERYKTNFTQTGESTVLLRAQVRRVKQ